MLKKTISIHAPASKDWDTLANLGLNKQWLYRTNTVSDWKAGSAILFTGNWQGIEYKDKGKIIDI